MTIKHKLNRLLIWLVPTPYNSLILSVGYELGVAVGSEWIEPLAKAGCGKILKVG
jgi:hypothetical protein